MFEPVPFVVEDTVGRRRTKADAPRRFLGVSCPAWVLSFTVSATAVGGGGATGGGGGGTILGDDRHMVTLVMLGGE